MRHNEKILQNLRNQLIEVLSKLPDEFALEQTKSYIRKSIASINEVEKKRENRKINAAQANTKAVQFGSLQDAANAIKLLDSMLEKEQKDIDKAESGPDELLNG